MDGGGIMWKRSSSRSNYSDGLVDRRPLTPNCPRCGSSNTKFCYYNNYSLTQPRFFCKSCRRYWTKGGSLRNVPVGGGSRKSRNRRSNLPPSPNLLHHRHSYHHHLLNHNSTTLTPPTTTAIINTTSSSHTPSSGSHIDLATVYANFLNTTTTTSSNSHDLQQPGPVADHNNVDTTSFGCVTISADHPPATVSTFPGLDQYPMIMQQYYYCGLDSWATSNVVVDTLKEVGTAGKSIWWNNEEEAEISSSSSSLFPFSSSNLGHDDQVQPMIPDGQAPAAVGGNNYQHHDHQPPLLPDDHHHGYNDMMMMFGNSSWSNFEFSSHAPC